MNEYLYIRAFGKILGSFQGYIEMEVDKAQREKAPQNAIFRRQNGSWATFDDIQYEDVRKRVQAIVDQMKK